MGTISQRKGRAGELELARILQNHGYDVHAGVSRSFGSEPDLTGFRAYISSASALNGSTCLRQWHRPRGIQSASMDGAPAVFHRRSREP